LEVGLDASCYHEVGDVKALASKIEEIVNKPLQRINYDMSKYNWDTIAGQVSEIYESLL
jgi:glycosyltransferase involved in cell wall biosynthesis